LKFIFQAANDILKEYDNKPGSFNIFNANQAKYKELNKLIDKINNKRFGTSDKRTLKTIRDSLHYKQKIEYTAAPTISPLKLTNTPTPKTPKTPKTR